MLFCPDSVLCPRSYQLPGLAGVRMRDLGLMLFVDVGCVNVLPFHWCNGGQYIGFPSPMTVCRSNG